MERQNAWQNLNEKRNQNFLHPENFKLLKQIKELKNSVYFILHNFLRMCPLRLLAPDAKRTSYVTGHKLSYLHAKGPRMEGRVTRDLVSSGEIVMFLVEMYFLFLDKGT